MLHSSIICFSFSLTWVPWTWILASLTSTRCPWVSPGWGSENPTFAHISMESIRYPCLARLGSQLLWCTAARPSAQTLRDHGYNLRNQFGHFLRAPALPVYSQLEPPGDSGLLIQPIMTEQCFSKFNVQRDHLGIRWYSDIWVWGGVGSYISKKFPSHVNGSWTLLCIVTWECVDC